MANRTLATFLLAACLLPAAQTINAAPCVFESLAAPVAAAIPSGNAANRSTNDKRQPPETVKTGDRQTGPPNRNESPLETRIREALEREGITGVSPEVKGDTVTLTGNISKESQRTKASDIVKNVEGVDGKKVKADGLKVFTPPNSNTDPNGTGSTGERINNSAQGTTKNLNNKNVDGSGGGDDSSWSFGDLLYKTLIILGGLLVVALLGYALWMLVTSIRRTIEGYFRGVKRGQDALSDKFDTSIIGLKKEFNERLSDLKDELKILSANLKDDRREILDGVRKSGAAAAMPAYSAYSDQLSVPKENVYTFPVAADEYLSRMKRGAVIVKPDFQNGILVPDPDGKGELMLVQDPNAAPGGLFYVVPKVGYFQTKQDFYNYYEKYYDCPRPSTGEVWIIEPAVVDRVSGGWELREKGELEIK